MRWENIPKFISTKACYHANFGIVGYISYIRDMEREENLQMNPDFQRGHIWTIEQRTAYVEYILRGGKSGREFYFNQPSWRRKQKGDYDDFVCVDGLQRTTAIEEFLNNKLPVFGCYYKDFDSPLSRTEYPISIWINDLITKEDVLTWYIQMNAGGTPHSQEEIDRVKQLLEECQHMETE